MKVYIVTEQEIPLPDEYCDELGIDILVISLFSQRLETVVFL